MLNEKLMDVLGEDVSMKDAFRAADDVLYNAVAGIAEIINSPGLVNVDFEDVRTVMAEMGMAMMGSAYAAGIDRARVAAEQAVASPLLEGINLAGARGVLVNITASDGPQDARDARGDAHHPELRRGRRPHHLRRGLRRGDGRQPAGHGGGDRPRQPRGGAAARSRSSWSQRTGTDNAGIQVVDYGTLESAPAVFRKNRNSTIEALSASGVDKYDIPAFLRKQAD